MLYLKKKIEKLHLQKNLENFKKSISRKKMKFTNILRHVRAAGDNGQNQNGVILYVLKIKKVNLTHKKRI